MDFIMVGLGGFIGACARYSISRLMAIYYHGIFPFPTLVVNISGCFMISIISVYCSRNFSSHQGLHQFMVIGVLGSFTTFSAFGYESYRLLIQANYLAVLINIILSLLGCLMAVSFGHWVARLFW